eukprot:3938074-Pyramimonas_sp.AAC.1
MLGRGGARDAVRRRGLGRRRERSAQRRAGLEGRAEGWAWQGPPCAAADGRVRSDRLLGAAGGPPEERG